VLIATSSTVGIQRRKIQMILVLPGNRTKKMKMRRLIMNKLCEIKVTAGAESFKELVHQLTANGYRVDAAPVYKEYPNTGLVYWMIAIFDKEEKK
jgi:hypothetical protein